MRKMRKISAAGQGRERPQLRSRVCLLNTRALFSLSLMAPSELMEEDEIAVCGVASASVLLKKGVTGVSGAEGLCFLPG